MSSIIPINTILDEGYHLEEFDENSDTEEIIDEFKQNNVNKYFALVDCNNFFVSCERAFNPDLQNKPVVVLSNNDGCIISRSQEAKALGIRMGAPYFQSMGEITRNNVKVFSSNFALYADMSRRIFGILKNFYPDMEIYSIDEAFMLLQGDRELLIQQAQNIRKIILKWTGIPVSIGIAPTKTLAKVANEVAKGNLKNKSKASLKSTNQEGIKAFVEKSDWEEILKIYPVKEIWGIGRKLTQFLLDRKIETAAELICKEDKWIRENLKIIGLRTVKELQGIVCFGIDNNPATRKSIIASRSFGRPITNAEELSQSIASYISKAATKLRKDGSVAKYVQVYIVTNRFKKDLPQYYNSASRQLITPTDYTPDLIKAALDALNEIYRKGYEYKKSGVLLSGLITKDAAQVNLFEQKDRDKEDKLMQLMDSLNSRYGKPIIKIAREGFNPDWTMKSSKRSDLYTFGWSQLLEVKS